MPDVIIERVYWKILERYLQPEINLVPRACDPREGNEGSGIIRFREDSDWPLKWMRSSILATIPGFRQRIIPEPSFPSQGSQARGTRLTRNLNPNLKASPSLFTRAKSDVNPLK
jgi:hypothetical protein